MINLTPVASTKVKEIMQMQNPVPVALRVAVVGGGCSGFQYHMAFENQTNDTDEVLDFNGLKVAVDQMSSMYLEGVEIDYIETVEGAGFKFNNPEREEHLRLRQLVQRLSRFSGHDLMSAEIESPRAPEPWLGSLFHVS